MKEIQLTLSQKTEEGIHIFKLGGVLGVEGASGLQGLFNACLREKAFKLIIDMSELTFISSAGVGTFLSVVGELRKQGGDLIFVSMPEKIRRVFDSLDMLDYFLVLDSVEDAIKSFARKTGEEMPEPPTETPTEVSSLQTEPSPEFYSARDMAQLLAAEPPEGRIEALLNFVMNYLKLSYVQLLPMPNGTKGIFLIHKGDYVSPIEVEDLEGISSSLASIKIAVVKDGIEENSGFMRVFGNRQAVLLEPVLVEDHLEALLMLGGRADGKPFTDTQKAFLDTAAGMLSVIITNPVSSEIDTARELERRMVEMETLFIVSRELNKSLEVEDLINNFLIILLGQMSTNRAAFLIFDETNSSFTFYATKGVPNEYTEKFALPASSPLIALMSKVNEPVLTKSIPADLEARGRLKTLTQLFEIFLPLKSKGRLLGIVCLGAKVTNRDYTSKDQEILTAMGNQASTALDNAFLINRLRDTIGGVMKALISAIEAKDPFTRGHTERVARLSTAIADRLNLSVEDRRQLLYGCVLHDIGKIGIPESILTNPNTLTEAELRELQRHPLIGVSILDKMKFLDKAKLIVRHHHERFDGRGYPDGLAGKDIPLGARILSIANAFDAMTHDRRHRAAPGYAKALEEIRQHAGTQFDPELAQLFLNILSENPKAWQ
jgi:anti-anti-sigma factor